MFKTQKNIILISIFIAVLILGGAVFGLSKFGNRQSPNSVPFPNSSSQSLFQSNSSSNVKPLIADSEHDVALLEECDLAVRFKKSNEYKPKFFKDILNLKEIYYFTYAEPYTENFGILIICGKDNFYSSELKKIDSEIDLDSGIKYNKPSLNFCEKVKITQQICNTITPLMESKSPRANNFYFTQKNFFYDFDAIDNLDTFQPNSLAPSTPSVKL